MSTVPAIKFPQSPFVDQSGNISREWRQWLLNPQFITLNLGTVLAIDSGGTGIGTPPASGQLLIGDNGSYKLGSLTAGTSIGITVGAASITISVNHVDAGLIDSGTLSAARLPAFTGDVTTSIGSSATTLATVNTHPGTYGSANTVSTVTVNGKGLVTDSSQSLIAISNAQVSGLGSMSTQNSNSVTITGGTINGTSVTATTFGCNGKSAQASASVASAVSGTAGSSYTSTEQNLINNLVTLVNQLRSALVANGVAV